MNLDIIKKNINMISSSFTRNEAEKILKSKKVKYLKSKGIEEIYHIYGKVEKESNRDVYSTHVKISKDTNKILESACTCKRFMENRRELNNYVCSHIVATTFAFYEIAKKNMKKEAPLEKRSLNLDINIRCIKNNGVPVFKCEFRIGDGKTHLIENLKGFVDGLINRSSLRINDMLFFNYKLDRFRSEDLKVLKFLIINRGAIQERTLTVHRGKFKEFLNLIDSEKKINFNYEFINYEMPILKDNPEVALSLKLANEVLILKHHNKFPVALDSRGEVLFFNRKIYVPREKFIKSYMDIHEKFIKNRELRYGIDELEEVLGWIKNITNRVFLDPNVIEAKKKIIKWSFNIRDEEEMKINVCANYAGYVIDLIKDGKNRSFLRDKIEESKVEMGLEKWKFIKGRESFKFIGNRDERISFLVRGIEWLKGLGKVESLDNRTRVIRGRDVKGEITQSKEYFKLKYEIEGFQDRDIREAILSKRLGREFYKKSNSYLDLEDSEVADFLELVQDLGIELLNSGEMKLPKNKALYLDEVLKKRGSLFVKEGEILNTAIKRLIEGDYKRKLVPKAFMGELRQYQKEGFRWLNEITDLGFGGVLADDMGLGKTVQIIAFLLSQKKKKTIIVVPTSLIYNWVEEFEKFGPSLKVVVIHGKANERQKLIRDKYDVLITTYGTLKNDEKNYDDKFFDYLIIDEAQNIKNYKAQVTRAVKNIKAKSNIALTGTPIENNLLELWSIFDFVMEGYLFTKERFKEKFIDNEDLKELQKLVAPFILRREKAVVLKELPDKIESVSYIEMSKEERSFYSSYTKLIKEEIEKTKQGNVFAYITKLREACLSPSLIDRSYRGESSKVCRAIEIIERAIKNHKKVILFSQFTGVLSILEEKLKELEILYFYLDGGTNPKKRVEMVETFNMEEEKKVFLISLKAGGVGLNLTGASVVIHFDLWWNPAVENQATDRAYRFGQKSRVQVVKLVAKGTIEEKILNLQKEKKELIESIMDGEKMNAKGLKSLSKEEILNLFN